MKTSKGITMKILHLRGDSLGDDNSPEDLFINATHIVSLYQEEEEDAIQTKNGEDSLSYYYLMLNLSDRTKVRIYVETDTEELFLFRKQIMDFMRDEKDYLKIEVYICEWE